MIFFLHCFLQTDPKFKDLVEFHTSYKYLIYAKSQESYKQLGAIVANHEKKELKDVLEEYRVSFFEAIGKKGNINKTYNVLLHIFGYFKKVIQKEEKEHLLGACEEFKEGIIPLIAFTHYLASVKKINANGIKYILEMLQNNMDEKNKAEFLDIVEGKMEKLSGIDVKDVEII